MWRVFVPLVASLILSAGPAVAQPQDCASLPTSAQKARPCNPQQECLGKVQGKMRGLGLQSAERDCRRLPTSGTCYGPETYNPQAECRQQQQQRRR